MQSTRDPNPLHIIPQPKSTSLGSDKDSFNFRPTTSILYSSSSHFGIHQAATTLASLLQLDSNALIDTSSESDKSDKSSEDIYLIIDDKDSNHNEESYTLSILSSRVHITAATIKGLRHGIQTLAQISHASENKRWPAVEIVDSPSFGWRGAMLDVGRHFIPADEIKRFLKVLAYHKINIFHWHLVEDQGWRIEIEKYPRLTTIGAWRNEPARYGKPAGRYGGFYTKDDIRSVVELAEFLGITIVPEIELPGHSLGALAAYPHLGCTRGPYEVTPAWGIMDDVYCAGRESTFEFLCDVIGEVVDLFPGKYFHLGGDECPKGVWKECKDCNERKKKEGLETWDEMQSYFIKRIAEFIQEKGKIVIGWDEILEGGLAKGAIVQSWRGFEGGIEAARSGHSAIMSPTSHCYFDYPHNVTSMEDTYKFNPIPAGLTDEEACLIIGSEGCMWTERTSEENLYSNVYPRLLALATKLWHGTSASLAPFTSFQSSVLGTHLPLRLEGYWELTSIGTGAVQAIPKVITVPGNIKSNKTGWNTWPENAVDGDPSTFFWTWQEPDSSTFWKVKHLRLEDAKKFEFEVITGLHGRAKLENGTVQVRKAHSEKWKTVAELEDGNARVVIEVGDGVDEVGIFCSQNQWDQMCVKEVKIRLLDD